MPDAAAALHGHLASICAVALDAWLMVAAARIARLAMSCTSAARRSCGASAARRRMFATSMRSRLA
jgi:hypothetical protein